MISPSQVLGLSERIQNISTRPRELCMVWHPLTISQSCCFRHRAFACAGPSPHLGNSWPSSMSVSQGSFPLTTAHCLQALLYLSVWHMQHLQFYISSLTHLLAPLLLAWLTIYFQAQIKCLFIGSKCLCSEPVSLERAQSNISVTRAHLWFSKVIALQDETNSLNAEILLWGVALKHDRWSWSWLKRPSQLGGIICWWRGGWTES